MRVLYVVASCLSKNTSANMSHNAYVQGLLENGCEVDIIMPTDSWGESDSALPRFKEATYYEYKSRNMTDKIRDFVRTKIMPASEVSPTVKAVSNENKTEATPKKQKKSLRTYIKKLFYVLFPVDPIYPLEKVWLKTASKFKSDKEYDLVVSNSCPEAAHKLVTVLRNKNRIKYKRWIQIWEDPWFLDIYGGRTEAVRDEEHLLLREASEVYYVSPLTMTYQKKFFSDCADKMKCIPLPFLKTEEGEAEVNEKSFGYFGDYYSVTRNLLPFYEAICECDADCDIYGSADLNLKSTERVNVSGRVTLDVLAKIQDRTGVLVHLCNLKGGQIPGKIYHYSATDKPILFILDGTSEEKEIIKEFFSKFDRYLFCDNDKESIKSAINILLENYSDYKGKSVDAFAPKQVISTILGD